MWVLSLLIVVPIWMLLTVIFDHPMVSLGVIFAVMAIIPIVNAVDARVRAWRQRPEPPMTERQAKRLIRQLYLDAERQIREVKKSERERAGRPYERRWFG